MAHNTIPYVTLYTKEDCSLCEKAKDVLKAASQDVVFHYAEVDITKNPELFGRFKEEIPVLYINDRKAFKYTIDSEKLLEKLQICR